MGGGTEGFDGEWGVEFEGPEGEVIPVGAEVGHGAVAEVPPAIPFGAGVVDFVEGAVGGGADPEVPVEMRGWGLGFGGAFGDVDAVFVGFGVGLRLQAPGAGDADVGVGDSADGSGLDEFDDAAVVGVAVDLGAHLGGDAGGGGGLGDEAGFVDVVGEGFFAVDGFFEEEGGEGGVGVGVFGGGDDDGVDV
jgi:hypothetical protein